MKSKSLKALLGIVLAVVVALGIGLYSRDHQLKASEGDGETTAAAQQEVKKEESKPIEVVVPKEEPKKEEREEESKKEEPKDEAKKEEPAEKTAEEAPARDESVSAEETPAQAEQTEAPAEETPTAEETVPEGELKAKVKLNGSKDITVGDRVELEAVITGDAEIPYEIQWQYKDDNGWHDIKGENKELYRFDVTEENAVYTYRVVVTY